MGLFSSLKHIIGAIAPAVGTALGGPLGGAIGGGVSGLLSGHSNKSAVGGANDALQLGLTNAENALNSQYGKSEANFNPFIMGGQQAFGQEGNLLGLNGMGAQGSAISALQSSPLLQSLFRQGQDTILNNASATGGLRGGNVQSSLANFGSDTLAQVLQQQLQNLGGVSQMGLGAAGQLGQIGAQNAGSLADLLVGSGKANAGSILNNQAVNNNTDSQLGKLFSGSGVTDQLGNLAKGLFGGSGGSGGSSVSSLTLPSGQVIDGSFIDQIMKFAKGGILGGGIDSGYGKNGGALPNFPNINIALPSSTRGLPGF